MHAHAENCMRHIHLATPMIDSVVFLIEGVRLLLLLTSNFKDLGFVHLSPFSYKHVLIVLCAWFVGSILFSAVPTPFEAHHATKCRRCDSLVASVWNWAMDDILWLNVENRQLKVSERSDYMASFQIYRSWLQSTVAPTGPLCYTGMLLSRDFIQNESLKSWMYW